MRGPVTAMALPALAISLFASGHRLLLPVEAGDFARQGYSGGRGRVAADALQPGARGKRGLQRGGIGPDGDGEGLTVGMGLAPHKQIGAALFQAQHTQLRSEMSFTSAMEGSPSASRVAGSASAIIVWPPRAMRRGCVCKCGCR